MTEIAKCRCGADAEWQISTDGKVGRWCRRCGIHGPWCDFEELMDVAWNSLMRPRPVARWRVTGVMEHLGIGKAVLLSLLRDRGAFYCWSYIADTRGPAFTNEQEAREWGADHLRGLGFDVEIANG